MRASRRSKLSGGMQEMIIVGDAGGLDAVDA